jgi:DNA repair photolyase
MSEPTNTNSSEMVSNIIRIPVDYKKPILKFESPPSDSTPTYDKLLKDAQALDQLSKYPCTFDYSVYRDLELRYKDRPIFGGVIKKNPFKLVNSHSTCQQCLYAFEVDTYGRGCAHNCSYCYAKAELTVHGMWNNPIPVPIDLNEVRKIFYNVFETSKRSKWRSVMEKKIPLRMGGMSDSFMWMDTKYGVTKEFIKILNYYKYPYTIITRSDLVARDDYMALLQKDLCSVQFSIASTNDTMNKLLEPGAPSAKRRLLALEKLNKNGYWTAVRINPMFPIYPDGYFTNPEFQISGSTPKFEYSSFEMVDEIADAGVPAIICGFGRFSSYSMNQIEKATGVDFRQFFDRGQTYKSVRDWHFSDNEIRYYYEEVKRRTIRRALEFTVCYIGNGENQFWETQDLWSNKKDCCNIKDRVSSFKTDSREVPFSERLRFTKHQSTLPINADLLHKKLGISVEDTNTKKFSQSVELRLE